MSTILSAWFVGDGSLLIQCAAGFAARGHDVVGVVTADPAVVAWAAGAGITHCPALDDHASALAVRPFDYLFSVVNLRMMGPAALARPRRASLNYHDGPLPVYAGLNAPAWALLNGEPQHGVTWHEMTVRPDAGRILRQRLFPIPSGATSLELNVLCYEAALASFADLLDDLESNSLAPIEQDFTKRSYFGRDHRPAGACVIQPSAPANALAALTRALDFGPYPNPLGSPKLPAGRSAAIASRVRPLGTISGLPAGTVLDVDAETGELVVATATEDVVIDRLLTLDGRPLNLESFLAESGTRQGSRLQPPSILIDALESAAAAAAAHETAWVKQLKTIDPVSLPGPLDEPPNSMPVSGTIPLELPETLRQQLSAIAGAERQALLVTALGCALARLTGRSRFDVGYSARALRERVDRVEAFFIRHVPIRFELPAGSTGAGVAGAVAREIDRARRRGLMLVDLLARYPSLASLRGRGASLGLRVVVDDSGDPQAYELRDAVQVALVARGESADWSLAFDRSEVSAHTVAALGEHIVRALESLAGSPDAAAAPAPARGGWDRRRSLHDPIEAQAERTPNATAAVAGADRVTYAELNARANRLARHLRGRGVGPDVLVGISLDRSIDLVVAVLAVLKAGGAYVPLDPAYPPDRVRFMSTDAALGLVITRAALRSNFAHVPATLSIDADEALFGEGPDSNLPELGDASRLAYVIYTSGSSGTPKGVMLEHRNVLSFFAAMDEAVPGAAGGVWLAVTSLSFDISVLELLWTLTRGFMVVIAPESGAKSASRAPLDMPARPIDFSLFYFSADEGEPGNRYRLLMEGARFADRNGFAAVWTPERHFHAFGGLYPNPAVTGAAIAAITERVKIRAGSCVLPLHHPIRVAEEWSVVDNISRGRAGVSVATGWQPNDFVLRPENFASRKEAMLRDLDVVRRLWRGETIEAPGPAGKPVQVRVFPRPVQAELPVWMTAAGNPETFAAAGESGAGVLTHLVGQTIDELVDKIALYRSSREKAGHPGPGHVVLMLHTLVGRSDAEVREIVRKPLSDYLKTSINLIKPFASTFPTFKRQCDAGRSADDVFASLTETDMDALVEHSFERYVETGGLFGTPDTCLRTIARLKQAGVDEVACLIDFGVPADTVLSHLEHLNQLRERANAAPEAPPEGPLSLIARHAVTHLQCTPSMATMLLLEEGAADAFGRLQTLLVGGEAFPASLARRLRDASPAAIVNMYGPTETTVWSATHRVEDIGDQIPIGRAIGGTELLVLDDDRRPVPDGDIGELYIGGPGVARGYLGREALTRERFITHPLSDDGRERVYKTGDLVRRRADGALEFVGRSDFQVKVRGHRIELGEIEAVLASHPGVREAVVVAKEDAAGDTRLVGYVVPAGATVRSADELREYVGRTLPDVMVPSSIVLVDAFPLTPNAKIDRGALPSPFATATPAPAAPDDTADAGSIEAQVARVWAHVLQVPTVGRQQNFFDLGGHSLLAAQVLVRLKHLEATLSLTDLFRYPTVGALAAHIGRGSETTAATAVPAVERAAARQSFLAKRQAIRRPGRPGGD